MAELEDLSTTDASNTGRFPEAQTFSSVNNGARALEGMIARWYADTNGSIASTGTDTIALAAARTVTAYAQGQVFMFEAGGTNTGAATLNVDAVGAKAVVKRYNVALAAGDIVAGQIVAVAYEASADNFQLLTPPATSLDSAAIGVTVQGYDADIPTVSASQAEMEAGTETALRSMSPLRVKQAIDALGAGGKIDMRLAFLKIAENAGDRINMVDGSADPFADESDVDTATSANETYDATGDFYSGLGAAAAISGATGTVISSGVSGASNAFDGSKSDAFATGAQSSPTHSVMYLGKDWGSGNDKVVTKVTFEGWTDQGFTHSVDASMTITLYGSATGTFGGEEVDLGGAITFTDTSDNTLRTLTPTSTTAYRYHRAHFDMPSAGANQSGCVEMEFFEQPLTNMTLVSNAFTADSAPDTGRVHVQVVENESITINTDLTAEISRDGGTNWTAVTLALVETLADGTKAYEDAAVDISGQPSATSMKYRIKTLNTKDIEVHGVVLQWA